MVFRLLGWDVIDGDYHKIQDTDYIQRFSEVGGIRGLGQL